MDCAEPPYPGDGEGPVREVTLSPFAVAATAELPGHARCRGHAVVAAGPRRAKWRRPERPDQASTGASTTP
jgi:hypothetical protein